METDKDIKGSDRLIKSLTSLIINGEGYKDLLEMSRLTENDAYFDINLDVSHLKVSRLLFVADWGEGNKELTTALFLLMAMKINSLHEKLFEYIDNVIEKRLGPCTTEYPESILPFVEEFNDIKSAEKYVRRLGYLLEDERQIEEKYYILKYLLSICCTDDTKLTKKMLHGE